MSLGQRLRRLRKEKDLTIRQMAKQFNIGKTTVANYEKDDRKPDYEMIRKFAEYFDVTVDYLVGRTDDPNIYIIEKEKLPKEFQDIGIEYMEVAKEMKDKEISPEKIKKIIELLEKE